MHQYIERGTGKVINEEPYGDRIVRFLYGPLRENSRYLFNLLTSKSFSNFLAYLNYDFPFNGNAIFQRNFLSVNKIDLTECIEDFRSFTSAKKIFERKIMYWDKRPMNENPNHILSPSDSRIIIGSTQKKDDFFIKQKFFDFNELIGFRSKWVEVFNGGDYAICRLTPDKYHYNHTPVSGVVVDLYEVNGKYHSCNPGAFIENITPVSKNKRIVTIIDTNVKNGTGIGCVAMIEIVALMIGEIIGVYSDFHYENPKPIKRGMFLERGLPKSLYRPGSSTTVLFFENKKIKFEEDLVTNSRNTQVKSNYSFKFSGAFVETDIKVRETIAQKI